MPRIANPSVNCNFMQPPPLQRSSERKPIRAASVCNGWKADLSASIATPTTAKEQSTNMSTQGTRVASSAGTIGAIIAAMSCTACFPALAVLASALGLGFLSQFESISIRYILPLFALIGLAANVIGGLRRRDWMQMVLGIIGPLLVLAAAMLMATFGMATEWLLYPGLVLMIVIAIWDLKTTRSTKPRGRLDT